MQWLTKVVLILVVGLCLCLPLIERVDFWDNWPATGNDLELTELSVLLAVGFALGSRSIRTALRSIIVAVCNAIAALAPTVQTSLLPQPRSIPPHQVFSPPLSSLRI